MLLEKIRTVYLEMEQGRNRQKHYSQTRVREGRGSNARAYRAKFLSRGSQVYYEFFHHDSSMRHETATIGAGLPATSELSQWICENLTGHYNGLLDLFSMGVNHRGGAGK